METYKCNKCGMAVNASCASCDEPLRNDYLTLEDGNKVQISICLLRRKDKISTMLWRRYVV